MLSGAESPEVSASRVETSHQGGSEDASGLVMACCFGAMTMTGTTMLPPNQASASREPTAEASGSCPLTC